MAARTVFSFGRREDVGDVEVARDGDVEARGDVGLRVEVDHEGPETLGEGRRRESERHRRLADAPFERADAEYMHDDRRYRQ